MKKILTTILVLASISTFAQIRPLSHYGFKVGTGISQTTILDNPTDIRSKYRNDFNVGAFYRWNIKKVSIQPEVYFQIRGGSFKATTTNFTETGSLILRNKYQYVSIPLILGYEVAKNIHIIAGPEYGFAVNAGTKYGPYAQNDFNLIGGIRIDMLDMAHLFSLNFRYVHGLSNTTNKTYTLADKSVIPLDFRNRTLQISATFNFSEYYHWNKKGKKK
jgi:hypothetical protein